MHRPLIIASLLFCVSVSFAQEALDQLLLKYRTDADMTRRLRKFKSEGAEKSFDVSLYQPKDFIAAARSYLGIPYKYGGQSRTGIDCSGLIVQTMEDLGLYAPHNANELAKYGRIILDKNELKPGDMIFFSRTYNTPRLVSHVGFVIEGDQMLHASNSGVNITSIHNPYYYDKHYLFGTRIFEEEVVVEPDLPVAVASSEIEPVSPKVDIMKVGYVATLKARVHNTRYRGKFTKSGEKYRKGSLTTSHSSYPFGTLLRLTNPVNGKTIDVRVNDRERGRYKNGLHVSAKAARKLKIKKGRTSKVQMKVLRLGNG